MSKFRSPLAIAIATVVLYVTAVSLTAASATSRPTPLAHGSYAHASTTMGADGPVSPSIVAENQLPGTTSWHLSKTNNPTYVQGFASTTYATVGQTVNFYVSSKAPKFQAYAYRMGYYQGLGARLVWTSPVIDGSLQPTCPLNTATNMVSCSNWNLTFSMPIDSTFVPGDYLIKFQAGANAASYVLLTVADPTSSAAYVVMTPSFVEQGWNNYGGYDFYAGLGACTIDQEPYPVCNRARVVSFDRPYQTGSGSSDFLNNDFPIIRLMEQEGLDVTYVTDVEVSEHPALLLQHNALIDLAHDESWTYEERMAVQAATAHGINVAYFGAAAMVRHVRLQPSPLGADREEVDYRNGYEDPLYGKASPMQVTGNTWAVPPTDWPPTAQIGEQYSGYIEGVRAPMIVTDSTSWFYENTGLTNGSSLPGMITSDFDHAISSSLTPSGLQILAHSPIPASEGTVSGEVWNGYTYSDVVYFTNPTSKAGVINMGNNVWIGQLQPCPKSTTSCVKPLVTTMTNNVLRLFGGGPAGEVHPSLANTDQVVPAGS